ncbi:SAM-dependent methyltransferase [Caldimonas sp. KR1-144]|uniref:SAM-dependent methyltransferase n=1 Tax=Caldimonas sp. KR1-144 TaxID=3400911 RepID=UPI003C12892C
MNAVAPRPGTLLLVPNTLDLGTWSGPDEAPDLRSVLPQAVIETAAGLGHWVCENAKSTRAMLKRIGALVPLSQPLQALDLKELPRPPKGARAATDDGAMLDALLAPALAGHDLGLVSEAGLPGVADPGAALVARAHRRGIPVRALSGPSSITLALAASGLNGQSFAFVGYVPQDSAALAQRLRELEQVSRKLAQTQVLIETPYRNAALWQALLAGLSPATQLSVSCGLTLEGGFSRTDTVARWRTAPPIDWPAQRPAVFLLLA